MKVKTGLGFQGGQNSHFTHLKKAVFLYSMINMTSYCTGDVQKVQQLFVLAEQKLVEVCLVSLQAYLPAT